MTDLIGAGHPFSCVCANCPPRHCPPAPDTCGGVITADEREVDQLRLELRETQALLRARDAELLRMNDGWGKHTGRAMDAVVAEEREACAKVAADHIEDHTCPECDHDTGRDLSLEVAAAIRARDNR